MSDHQSTEAILQLLKSFGVSGTEGKAYLALLRDNPATGYDIAARGDVPRSAIYGCLKRLEATGLVIGLPGKPARYIPKAPKQVIKEFEARTQRDLRLLEEALEGYASIDAQAPTWTLRKEETINSELERLIEQAQSTLFISLWKEDAELLRLPIEAAVKRGVQVILFSFTAIEGFSCPVLSYGIEPKELETHWPRRISLLSDKTHLLTGTRTGGEDESATYSEEAALTQMALANMVLDITLYGERHKEDISELLSLLTPPLAPIDELTSSSN